ncbi:MAG: branched-chain-amino-acid transaminase [Nitrospirae bacterium]|nr:branched-chain-amino-acid transaminase [Nitrospirota bacterium]
MFIYLNGRLVPEEKARVSVFDHGFLYGDGIYETMRAYCGVVFMIDEHIRRLFRSGELIKLKIVRPPDEIKRAIYNTLSKNRLKDAYIRLSISRGPGEIGLDPGLCPKPTIVIITKRFKEYPEEIYKKGVRVSIVKTRRNAPEALNPKIKSLNFLNNILAKIEAKEAGVYEAVMLNYRGYLAEGTITNIFFVKDGSLFTPSVEAGILDGITRKLIMKVAKGNGVKVEEGLYTPESLYGADEAFITNTTLEILPVTKVDNKTIGNGIPGPITGELHKGYKEEVERYLRTGKI